MQIEIWSDIACPWCYVGRRRLESALNNFEHRDQVEIVWRSFELDPNAPDHYPGTVGDMLTKKYGMSRQQVEAGHAHLTELGAQVGIAYHFDTMRPGNSFDAHRVIHLAEHHGLQSEMKERIQRAYFTEGQAFSDHPTLVQLATEIGLDADETRQMLASDTYAADVRADERRAAEFGISGVPFFLFDEKYAISGAQPTEVFTTALEKAWQDRPKKVQMVGGDAEMCEDDNCAV